MKFDIELATPFHYSTVYLILSMLGLVVCLGFLIWVFWRGAQKRVIPEVKKPPVLDVTMIKKKYLIRLDELSHRVDKNNPRAIYQELSLLMRSFVTDVTGIKVTKLTLREIDRKSFPILYDMIEEFYSPEFSREGFGDPILAIDKVRRGIEEWK